MSFRTNIPALTLASLMFFISCKETKNDAFLGSAVVSGDTYQITAVTQGNIVTLSKEEGQTVSKGELLAIIDTVPLYLKEKEAQSAVIEINLSISAKQTEIQALQSDVDGVKREYLRIDTLASKGAVPSQQRDNLKTQYESAQLRMQASQNSLTSMHEKVKGQQFRIDQIKDQIRRCYLKSPANGLVLTRFRSIDEVVGPGNPIYEIAKFDTLKADFFVPQPMLSTLKFGQNLQIRIDMPQGQNASFIPGILTWISPDAEFSPKNIQTRESRNELVFRVRVMIPNPDGTLKKGLPVEVWR